VEHLSSRPVGYRKGKPHGRKRAVLVRIIDIQAEPDERPISFIVIREGFFDNRQDALEKVRFQLKFITGDFVESTFGKITDKRTGVAGLQV